MRSIGRLGTQTISGSSNNQFFYKVFNMDRVAAKKIIVKHEVEDTRWKSSWGPKSWGNREDEFSS